MGGSAGSGRGALVAGGWRSVLGALWRTDLAVSVGGVTWRTSLAVSPVVLPVRSGTDQPALMGGLAGSGRSALVAGGWRSVLGALWRTDLAVSVGGVTWRTSLAVSPVVLPVRSGTDQPALMGGLAGSGRSALVAGGWRSLVGALCLAVSDWRTDLAV